MFTKDLFAPPRAGMTEVERALDRAQRSRLTFVTSVGSRGIGLVLVFASLNTALPYLGAERFGVLAVIAGIATFLSLMDFGIANSLVSRVAELHAENRHKELKSEIANAFVLLVSVGSVLAAFMAVLVELIPLELLFKSAREQTLLEAKVTLHWFVFIFALSIPAGAVIKIFVGLQIGYVYYLVLSIPTLFSVVMLYLIPSFGGGLPVYLIVLYAPATLAAFIGVAVLPRLGLLGAPVHNPFQAKTTRDLVAVGMRYFILQVLVIMAWGLDSLYLSALVGPDASAQWYVMQRLFLLVSVPLALFNTPLWGGYADANARQDFAYLRSTLFRSMLLTILVAGFGGLVLVLLRTPISIVVARDAVQLPITLTSLYAVWVVMEACYGVGSIFLNGVRSIAPQIVAVGAFVLMSIPLKWWLIQTHGLPGMAYALLICFAVAILLPFATVFRGAFGKPLGYVS